MPTPTAIHPPRSSLTLSGAFEDVAAFFRVSVPTVERWKADGLISSFKQGRNVMFGIEDVVTFKLTYHVAADGALKNEIAERTRREWREHMLVRSQPPELRQPLEELQRRVAHLEQQLTPSLAA